MPTPDPIYPAKRTQSPGGNFVIRQYFLPIRLNGEEIWALLDTGAHVSILPKSVAEDVLIPSDSAVDSGTYPLAGLVEVPYHSFKLDFEILSCIEGTIPELDIQPYVSESKTNAHLRNVEFQVPILTWPEIGDRMEAEHPVSIRENGMNFVILGLHGVLDQLNLSFTGNNSVSVGPKGPDYH